MQLKIQKKSERDKSSIVAIEGVVRGVLSDRILLSLFPLPFLGEISQAQAEELLEILANQARQQLLKYVAESEHSSKQCQDYLSRKMYPAKQIEALIKEFVAKKYIDDARFLRILIASLIERQKSKGAIIGKLKETRLPSQLWESILSELFVPADSLETLKEQVLILRLRYSELPRDKQKEKIFASLFRKGYELDDIHSAWQASLGK